MDLKIRGITAKILAEALEQAKKAKAEILSKMTEVLPEPKNNFLLMRQEYI